MQYYKTPEQGLTVDTWKLWIFGAVALASMGVHFLLAIFSVLLMTGTVIEWTMYFGMTTAILVWTWINHLISIRVICDSTLITRIRKYMIFSYCVQLALYAMMALPIFGFYAAYHDARGLWIAVAYSGVFNWVLLAIVFAVFYYLLAPPAQSAVQYIYMPVAQQKDESRLNYRQGVMG